MACHGQRVLWIERGGRGLEIMSKQFEASPASTLRDKRILVVDDEVEVAELVAEVLLNDGHDVVVAHSGNEGLRAISGRRFDIVLSDLRMPDLDGPGLLRALQRERPELVARIAFMTGDKLSPDVEAFLKGSTRPHIEKPISPGDVRALIQRVLTGVAGSA